MRISDWSSDVCSSDLAASAASFCLRTWPGARQSSRLKPLLQGCLAQAKRRHWLPAFASRPGASDSRRGRLLLFAQAVGRVGAGKRAELAQRGFDRSEEHTSELQSLMRISYAVFCLKKKTNKSILNKLS